MNHKDMQKMHFPSPGTLGLKGQIIDFDLKIRLLKLEQMQIQKIYDLHRLVHNYVFLKRYQFKKNSPVLEPLCVFDNVVFTVKGRKSKRVKVGKFS